MKSKMFAKYFSNNTGHNDFILGHQLGSSKFKRIGAGNFSKEPSPSFQIFEAIMRVRN